MTGTRVARRTTIASAAQMNESTLSETLDEYAGRQVVVDTAGTIVYLGVLKAVTNVGLWLENADLHDCHEGHAGKELYVYEAKRDGIRTNRKRLFVMRSAVISIAALEDVVQEDVDASSGVIQ